MRKINSQLPFSLQHVSLYKLSFHHTRTRPPFMLRKCSCLSERGMTMRACAFTIFQKAKMAATSQYRRISQQVNWTIVICTFLFLLTRLATERKQEEICREFSLRLMKIIRLPRWVKSYTNLSKHFFTWQRALREENFTKVRNKLSTIVVIFANFPAKIPLPRKSSLLHIKTCD